MLNYIRQKITDIGGVAIGYLEMIGFRYPVKKYRFKVSEALWRGSRLDDSSISELKDEGFKLIVNLCAENDNDSEPALACGIATLRLPIMDNQVPKQSQVKDFLSAVQKTENQPAYVHCEAGKGRTGVMVACYRVAAQGWTVDAAITEAKAFGMAMTSQDEFVQKFAKDCGLEQTSQN